jgi:hypothetical protein
MTCSPMARPTHSHSKRQTRPHSVPGRFGRGYIIKSDAGRGWRLGWQPESLRDNLCRNNHIVFGAQISLCGTRRNRPHPYQVGGERSHQVTRGRWDSNLCIGKFASRWLQCSRLAEKADRAPPTQTPAHDLTAELNAMQDVRFARHDGARIYFLWSTYWSEYGGAHMPLTGPVPEVGNRPIQGRKLRSTGALSSQN